MNVKIEISDADGSIVDGICSATNYDSRLGIAKTDWVSRNIADYILRMARQGKVLSDVALPRQGLGSAMKLAIQEAAATIPSSAVLVDAVPAIIGSGGGVITKP